MAEVNTVESVLIGLDAFRSDPLLAGITGRGQSVAVVDSGFDLNHPAFGPDRDGNGVADRILFQYDFARTNDGDAGNGLLANRHGTHVTGIAGSQSLQYQGIAPESGLILLKVGDDSGAISSIDVREGLEWIGRNHAAYGIAAVNMSFGSRSVVLTGVTTGYLSDVLAALRDAGVAPVAAAGNESLLTGVGYPAADPSVITVGATEGGGFKAYSNRSPAPGLIDITAPGNATSSIPDDSFGFATGTSMASPVIAGVAALMSQLASEITAGAAGRIDVDTFTTLMRSSADLFYDAATTASYPRIHIERLALAVTDHYRTEGLHNPFGRSLYGWRGNDTITGTDNEGAAVWNDRLSGGEGADLILGLAGRDHLMGGAGEDTLDGGLGVDAIDGGSERDVVFGAAGGDVIAGGGGGDYLDGGSDSDTIDGQAGEDLVIGGPGYDLLSGGEGSDVFLFRAGDGPDVIRDFVPGSAADAMALQGFGLTSFAQIQANLSFYAAGNASLLQLGTDLIFFEGAQPEQFDASDFFFF